MAAITLNHLLRSGRISAQCVFGMTILCTVILLRATPAMAADPVAVDDVATLIENGGTQELNVLANDTDADNDIDSSSVTVMSPPSSGTIDSLAANGSLWYTPDPDFNGADNLIYEVSDVSAGTDQAEVFITVVPDAPVANNDSATAEVTVAEDGGSQPLNVLANDTDVEFDIDSATVLEVPGSGPFYGTIDSLDADGSLWYTPGADYNGEDTFQYEVADLGGDKDTADVTVLVTSDGTELTADFTWDLGTAFVGASTAFADSTTESPTSWTWDFGDGSPVETIQNPTHAYSDAGTYQVQLIASNAAGEADTVTKTVTIGSKSTAGAFEEPGMRVTLLAVVNEDTTCTEATDVDFQFQDKVVLIICVANDDALEETITDFRFRSRMDRAWSVSRIALYRESGASDSVVSQGSFDKGEDVLVNSTTTPGLFEWDGSTAGDAVDFSVSSPFGEVPAGDSVYYYVVVDAAPDSILVSPGLYHTRGVGVALNATGAAAEAITTVNHGAGPVEDAIGDVTVVMDNGPNGTIGGSAILGAGCLQQPYLFDTSPQTTITITAPTMTVGTNTTSLKLPLRIENGAPLSYINVPVKLEPLTGDAYVEQIAMRFDDRMADTTVLEGIRNLYYFNERASSSPCPYSPDSAVDGSVVNVVTSTEAAIQFGGCITSPPCPGSATPLPNGSDLNGSLVMTVDIGLDTGRFEIDEACMEILGGLEVRDLLGNPLPVTFEPGIITVSEPDFTLYVDSANGSDANPGTMAEPFATIQTAMDSANPAAAKTTIMVGPGTYAGPIFFNDAGRIELISEDGPFATHLVGDSTDPVVVLRGTFTGQTQSIRGFTIRDNYCTECPGGIEVQSPVIGTIVNCIVRNNYGDNNTGGIYFFGPSGTIASNWIVNNIHSGSPSARHAGGIFIDGNSIVSLTNNTIAFNESGSDGSGVYVEAGGVVHAGGRGHNDANAAGASLTRLDNNIVFRNRPRYGLFAESGHLADSVRTSVVSENGPSPGSGLNLSETFSYEVPTVILSGDPLFVDTTTGDFHIACGSPALGLGRSVYVPSAVMYDIDGQDRLGVDTTTVDAGADEFIDTNKVADFELADPADTSACAPHLVEFTNLSECLDETWIWDFGDGTVDTGFGLDLKNPTHEYDSGGLYTVTLTAQNPFSSDVDSLIDAIRVDDKAHPTITSSPPGCAPSVVDLSATFAATADSLFWFFGDGDTAFVEGPATQHDTSHVYQDTGSYVITVRTFSDCGMAEGVDTVDISTSLDLELTSTYDTLPDPDSIPCTPFEVSFEATSAESIFTYTWLFGDGEIDSVSGAMPTHIYDSGGDFLVSLVVESACGIDTFTYSDTIRVLSDAQIVDQPIATPGGGCPGDTIAFTVSFFPPPDSVLWLFGDGDSSMLMTPTHVYDSVGKFVPMLTVWDGCGVETFDLFFPQDTIVMGTAPNASFTSSADSLTETACAPLLVRFWSDVDGDVVGYSWDFGDGGSSNLANPIHTYLSPGDYDVRLIANGPCGSDTVTSISHVTLLGGAEFTSGPSASIQEVCVNGDSIDFNVTVSPAVDDSATWLFGDGESATGLSVKYQYAVAGVYTPQFVYRHACGVDTLTLAGDSDSIVVQGLPNTAFSYAPDSGYAPLTVQFTDGTQNNPGNWLWTFGDDGTSSVSAPSHTYTECGEYQPTLTVTNECGSIMSAPLTDRIRVGDFDMSSQIIGTVGDSRVYRVDVDECVFYNNTVTLSAQFEPTPVRGDLVFDFDDAQGVPPFTTDMTAIPIGGLSAGEYTITITATDQQRGVSRTSAHVLDFEGVSLIEYTPAAMAFIPIDTGTCVRDTLCIRNSAQPRGTDSVLSILGVTSDNAAFQVMGATSVSLSPGDSAKWEVIFCPTELGADSATITIDSDDPVTRKATLVVTGSGIPEQTPPHVISAAPDSMQETTIDDALMVILSEAIQAPDPIADA
ncbi:MAG: PKD domain-containing protein, partial [candidate division Zixibacteria bacterium]|nr:PKD domain-containing protein [candidate division Zixibacteria bacterium]